MASKVIKLNDTKNHEGSDNRAGNEAAPDMDRILKEHFATALHEAAHAVVGEVLGFPCRHIKGAFWTHDRRTSRLLKTWPSSPKAKKQHADYAVAAIAGIAAEAVSVDREIGDELRCLAGAGDYEKVKTLAQNLSLTEFDPETHTPKRSEASLIAEWECRAMDLVRANWEWIEAVKGLFIDLEGLLSGADVRSCKPSQRMAA